MAALDGKRFEAMPAARRTGADASTRERLRQRYDPECRDDHRVFEMHKAFHATGGLLAMDQVLTLFKRHSGPDAHALRSWIHSGEAIAFTWDDATWLPMFQFSRKTLLVHHSLAPVLRELSAIFDGWEIANWFALPNTWLAERLPVDMLAQDLSAVWYAAQVERFIALGETTWDQSSVRATVDAPSGMTTMPTDLV